MASIAKRSDGRWRARYRDAAGVEHSRHFTRKVDAQHWLDTVTTAVTSGTYTDPRRDRHSDRHRDVPFASAASAVKAEIARTAPCP
jgi:hypothetical protein